MANSHREPEGSKLLNVTAELGASQSGLNIWWKLLTVTILSIDGVLSDISGLYLLDASDHSSCDKPNAFRLYQMSPGETRSLPVENYCENEINGVALYSSLTRVSSPSAL